MPLLPDRYTSADVKRAFARLVGELREGGVDTTHVQLTINGGTGRGLSYSVINVPGMTNRTYHGSREMWGVLHFAADMLRATRRD